MAIDLAVSQQAALFKLRNSPSPRIQLLTVCGALRCSVTRSMDVVIDLLRVNAFTGCQLVPSVMKTTFS